MTSEMLDNEISDDAPGLYDGSWTEDQWLSLLEQLVSDRIVTWREVTTTILGELNPGQVGTGIASADKTKFGFKRNHQAVHPGESFMPYVIRWLYATTGHCIRCGTRIDLQADHVDGRENFPDPMDADWLDNMALRCRRHNVAKRKSHIARAGRTLLPAQQALMWILYQIRPVTKRDFARLCRLYGMTMSDIRFDEAWAMAVWLEREGHYRIASVQDHYDIVRWSNNAITRRFTSTDPAPDGAKAIAADVPGESTFCFLSTPDGSRRSIRYYEFPLDDLPFAYDLGARSATDIAIWPNQKGGIPLAPRDQHLLSWGVRAPGQCVQFALSGGILAATPPIPRVYFKGAKIPVQSTDMLSLLVS